MRISDWSSDVCSSDLRVSRGRRGGEIRPDRAGVVSSRTRACRLADPLVAAYAVALEDVATCRAAARRARSGRSAIPPRIGTSRQSYGTPAHRQYGPLERKRISEDANSCRSRTVCAMILVKLLTIGYRATVRLALAFFVTMAVFLRSEEHTSELQSLMRNSYAVFCLNKKKTKPRRPHI